MKTKPFDAAKYMESQEDVAELVDDALASGHSGYIAAALGTAARAYGMSKLADETGLNRTTLYSALKEGGNPTLDTVVKVTSAFGVTLGARQATPARKAATGKPKLADA
ncbi:MAG: putative addiction module antidote protein [Devosia litorisediminis]